jgi:[ribosomal protein S18]-alanine N-acetyltransferase
LNICSIEARNIEAILAIQAASPETAQWVAWDYSRVVAGEMAGWIAEENGEAAGFLVGRQVVSDLEILNFAVAPAARRRGVGAALLQEAIGFGKAFRAANAFLEVRASNLAALEFYERRNFRATGRRLRYYTAPVEDALVLTLRLI